MLKKVEKLYEGFKISFSMYSKIPMPKSDWNRENMEYAMCFFPLVGGAIGIIFYLWWVAIGLLNANTIFQTVVFTLLPVFITGGIHLDGLLDTLDALNSYQSTERKLEILKDSNSGAFAVIGCCVYIMGMFGIYSMLTRHTIGLVSLSFLLSRTLSGLAVVSFPLAKDSGLAAMFSNAANKKRVKAVLYCYFILLSIAILVIGKWLGVVMLVAVLGVYRYYFVMSKKNFGGITGDLAGFFLQIAEMIMALVVVLGGNYL